MKRNYRILPGQTPARRSLETWVSGLALLSDPMLNRGTAFTAEEREVSCSDEFLERKDL